MSTRAEKIDKALFGDLKGDEREDAIRRYLELNAQFDPIRQQIERAGSVSGESLIKMVRRIPVK